jgi:hypothetical protein
MIDTLKPRIREIPGVDELDVHRFPHPFAKRVDGSKLTDGLKGCQLSNYLLIQLDALDFSEQIGYL